MDIIHPDYRYEQSHLNEVCGLLEAEIDKKDNEVNSYKSEIISIRKNMWENARHGFGSNETEAMIEATQYIASIKNEENSYRFTKVLLDKYRRLLCTPYFARIDFMEDGNKSIDSIYIGLYSFINTDTMEVVIHDWRAPISSVFYEYENGKAEYKTHEGSVHGDVSLNRQFKIKNSKLLSMFDSSVKIDDEILQEILSGNASEKMKSIVTTIQKEQNKVIRFDEGSVLIVQGAAGSGKTSIALHRIAYLLYKDRNLTSSNIVIFSPSHIFNDYISNVLPELGESNVIQTTFEEYITKLIKRGFRTESLNDHMEYLLSHKNSRFDEIRRKGYMYKNSREFLDAVRQFAGELSDNAEYLCNIYYDGKTAIKGSELRKVYNACSKGIPVNKRLAAVRERAFYLLAKVQEIKKIELKRKADNSNSTAREAAALLRLELRREFSGVRDKVFRMTKVDLYDAYRNFFESDFYFESGKAFGLKEDELKDIRRYSIDNFNSRVMNYEDSAVLAYLKCIIDDMPDTTDIKHVVVDEAQDYSPLQYEILKRLFPGSSFTILGDMNQLMIPYRKSVSFDAIADVFGRADSAVLRLSKSYRSTREITEFTKAMLPSDKEIEGLNRAGKLPEVVGLSEACEVKERLTADIKELLGCGMDSIAILCKTSEECSQIYKLLKGVIEISMVAKDDDMYKKGVNILPSYLCKGLEFDAVLVYGANEGNYNAEGDRKLLYTLCTRALHRLIIYYQGELSSIIREIDGELYKHIKEKN
ncbi:MAG TPA: UvrD-helicase domain-containing protein [Clostridia bacterium]|nr:UvrD-helicase domain-containing protein [Clostridia bacterium]